MASAVAQKTVSKISWATFKSRYFSREDCFKYEWVNGAVEKTRLEIGGSQLFMIANIDQFFWNLKKHNPTLTGFLAQKIDSHFAGNHRKPNFSFFTDQQLEEAKNGDEPCPKFVIDIVSKFDLSEKLNEKIMDYQRAEVKVIWHIFPQFKKVHVYHGNKMTVCRGTDLCSAEPVIEGFLMPTTEIFK